MKYMYDAIIMTAIQCSRALGKHPLARHATLASALKTLIICLSAVFKETNSKLEVMKYFQFVSYLITFFLTPTSIVKKNNKIIFFLRY